MGIKTTTSHVYTSPARCDTVTLDDSDHNRLVQLAASYAGHVPTNKVALIKTVRRLVDLSRPGDGYIVAEAMIEEAQRVRSASPMEPGDCCDD